MTDTRVLRLDSAELTYRLIRSARRTIGLRIDGSGLTVRAPQRARVGDIEQVLRDKQRWIVDKLSRWSEPRTEVSWASGHTLWWMGEALQLWVEQGVRRPLVARDGSWLRVWLRAEDELAAVPVHLQRWYRSQALPHFLQRVDHFAAQLGRTPPPVSLSNARTRWGSCSPRGDIRLNWRLIQTPPAQIDYVIAHELAHLLEMNHSARFWGVVATLYPDFEAARRALRDSGDRYFSF